MYSKDYKDSFLILINEEQRKLLERSVHLLKVHPNIVNSSVYEELKILQELLQELPQIENTYLKDDGSFDLITHGFCL